MAESGIRPPKPSGPQWLANWTRTLRRAREAVLTVTRHAPVSVTLIAILVAVAAVTRTLRHSVQDKSWFHDVAYGVPAFQENKWWTLFTGAFFGLTPWQLLTILVLTAVALAWSEWRLGSARLVGVLVAGQLVGVLGAALLSYVLSEQLWAATNWTWPSHLATVRDVGLSTGIVGAVAAASATLRSPWRLRVRAGLAAYVGLTLLFEGSLADVQHLVALIVMVFVGERLFSRTEHGLGARSRREVRLLAFVGLIVLAASHILVWFFPGTGPLGPTDSGDSTVWLMWVHVVVIAAVADRLRRGKRWAWWVTIAVGVFNIITLIVIVIVVIFTDYVPHGGVTLGTSILWSVETMILISGRFAFTVPWRVPVSRSEEGDVTKVKALLREHGGGTMSWMTTWEGNHYAFFGTGDATTAVCYRRHMGTLLALSDPIGAPHRRTDAVRGFIDLAESSGKMPCWFSVGRDTADAARQMGWRTVQIAEDAIVDLPNLAFKGKSWQDVRTAMNKAKKAEITHRLCRLADEPYSIRSQVDAISDEWVGDKGLPEMGFTLGSVDEALDPEVMVSLAVDADERVHGVLSWLPVYGNGAQVRGWTLDVMRRSQDGYGQVIEFLLGSALLAFQREGAAFVSLSGAPLAHSDEQEQSTGAERILDTLGAAMEPLYGFRSLHAFKKKFKPRYESVYLAYRDESDLPRIGVAISRAYLPKMTAAELVRLATNTSTKK